MKPNRKTMLSVLAGIFLLYLGIHYWPSIWEFIASVLSAATPIWIGCAVAYVVNILMSFYERHYFTRSRRKWAAVTRRPVCMIGALVTLAAIIALVVALVLPQLASCFSLVAAELPASIEKLIGFLSGHRLLPENAAAALSAVNWPEKIEQIGKWLLSGVGNVLDIAVSAVSSLVSGITTGVLAFIFTIYLLAGKERLGRQIRRFLEHYLRGSWYRRLMQALPVVNDSFHKFIVGQCTEAVILGVLCTVGMLILRLPYATMIGALIGFTALIPVIGAFIGGAVGAFLILMESPVQALVFLIFLVILQQVEGNLIYPRVVGTSIGLPAFWVLAVVTIAGSVFGILGILLGIPAAAAAYRLIYNDMHKPDPAAIEPQQAQ